MEFCACYHERGVRLYYVLKFHTKGNVFLCSKGILDDLLNGSKLSWQEISYMTAQSEISDMFR